MVLRDTGSLLFTFILQESVCPPSFVVTVMVASPSAMPVTLPPSTVATPKSSVVHMTALSVASAGATVAVRVNSSPITIVLVVSLSVTPVTFLTVFAGLQDEKVINTVAAMNNPKLKTILIIIFLSYC